MKTNALVHANVKILLNVVVIPYTLGIRMVFAADLPVVVREYQANVYSPTAFFVAMNAADTIQYLIFPTLYSLILYSLAGYSYSFGQYLKFNFLNIVVATLSGSVGYAAGCICGTTAVATTYVPMIVSPLFVFDCLGDKLLDSSWQLLNSSLTCTSQGNRILESMGVNPNHYWVNVTVLISMMIAIRGIALLAFIIRIIRS